MMLAEKAGVEAARLGELGFGDDFVDTAIEVLGVSEDEVEKLRAEGVLG